MPIAELGGLRSEVSLRLLPARSGQENGIRYASAYALQPSGEDVADFGPLGDADDFNGTARLAIIGARRRAVGMPLTMAV